MNPKSIIFLAAFLPQFLNTSSDLISQYIVLGVTVLTIDTLVMLTYAGIASKARCYLRDSGFVKTQSRIFGTFFIGTGIALAQAEQ